MKKLIFLFVLWPLSILANDLMINPSILYIGDSHSYGKFGQTLYQNLSTISDSVVMESSCGSSASTWLGKTGYEKTVCGFWKKDSLEEIRLKEHNTPKYADEMIKYQPKIAIIQLGTNMAAMTNPLNAQKSIEELIKLSKNNEAECIWIGPPDANSKIVTKEKLNKLNDLLVNVTRELSCFYIDSLKLTSFPKDNKEGIHYPPTLSKEWGEKVSAIILNHIHELNKQSEKSK